MTSYQPIRYARTILLRQDVVLPEPPYSGPGDVVSGALRWWGLRAYTLASVGTNAVRLRRDSDNAEQDFATITGGGLDIAAITSFKGAANLAIVTFYDQSGNGVHFTQAVAASQPLFILSGFGDHPVCRHNTFSYRLQAASGFSTLNQPFTFQAVIKRIADFTTQGYIFDDNVDSVPQLTFNASANSVGIYGGGQLNASATDNVFHSFHAVFNGASSDMNVDGTATTGNAGTDGFGTNNIRTNGNNALRADAFEFGVWASAFSGAQSSAMSANQSNYWGF
jgi:hypothetical protein